MEQVLCIRGFISIYLILSADPVRSVEVSVAHFIGEEANEGLGSLDY